MWITMSERGQSRGWRFCSVSHLSRMCEKFDILDALRQLHPTMTFRLVW